MPAGRPVGRFESGDPQVSNRFCLLWCTKFLERRLRESYILSRFARCQSDELIETTLEMGAGLLKPVRTSLELRPGMGRMEMSLLNKKAHKHLVNTSGNERQPAREIPPS